MQKETGTNPNYSVTIRVSILSWFVLNHSSYSLGVKCCMWCCEVVDARAPNTNNISYPMIANIITVIIFLFLSVTFLFVRDEAQPTTEQ